MGIANSVSLDRRNTTPSQDAETGAVQREAAISMVAEVKLKAAVQRLQRLVQLAEAGVVPASVLEKAKDEVQLHEAEMAGDPKKVAEARLQAAVRKFQWLSELLKASIVSTAEADEAKDEAQLREAELAGNARNIANAKLAAAPRKLN